MPAFNDATVPYGSQVITAFSGGATGVAFVAENISVKEPTNIIERFDELGIPSGQVIVPQFVNGSATLQFATTLTSVLTIGVTFTLTRNGGATIGCVVSDVSDPQTQKDAKKCVISFRKRYNS